MHYKFLAYFHFPLGLRMLIWCAFALIIIRSLGTLAPPAMENIPCHKYDDLFDNICIFLMCMGMHLIRICLKGRYLSFQNSVVYFGPKEWRKEIYIYIIIIFPGKKKQTSPALSPLYPLVTLLEHNRAPPYYLESGQTR